MQIPQITFLRFLAASAVVILHFGKFSWPFSTDALAPMAERGALGVSFFFTLSGFLLAWVYGRQKQPDWRRYARARFARVGPLYILSLVLSMAIWAGFYGKWPSIFYGLMQFSGLYAWWPDYSLTLNFPAWSVSVEFFLYATLPLLLPFLKRKSTRFLLIFSATIWLASACLFVWMKGRTIQWLDDPYDLFLLRFPPWHFNAFLTGLTGGILLLRNPDLFKERQIIPNLLIAASVTVLLLLCYLPNPFIGNAHDGLLSPVFTCLLIGVSTNRGTLSTLLSRNPLVFLGEISYVIYIFQAPLHQVFDQFVPDQGRTGVHGIWFWAYFGALILLSAVVHVCVEKPLRKWINGR